VDLRIRINAAVDAMKHWIEDFVAKIQFRIDNLGLHKRIRLYKIDDFYYYNRYCDFATKDGAPRDWKDDSWFFTIRGNDKDYDGNLRRILTCVASNAVSQHRCSAQALLTLCSGCCSVTFLLSLTI